MEVERGHGRNADKVPQLWSWSPGVTQIEDGLLRRGSRGGRPTRFVAQNVSRGNRLLYCLPLLDQLAFHPCQLGFQPFIFLLET